MGVYKTIALLLLVERLVSIAFIIATVVIQWRLLVSKNMPELRPLKLTLLILNGVILLGNVVPIVLDVSVLLDKSTTYLLVFYALSNSMTAMVWSFTFWLLYKRSKTMLTGK